MAKTWIPMRHDLPQDPAVIGIATATGLDEDAVVGKLLRVWSWFDSQTVDGNAPSVTLSWLDRYVGADGFGQAMVDQNWLIVCNNGLKVPGFDKFISQSAKQRALTAKRVSNHRNKKKRDGNEDGNAECNAPSVTGALATVTVTNKNSNSTSSSKSALIAGRDTWEREEPEEPKPNTPTPSLVLNLPVPPELLSPEFISAWHAWGRYQAERAGSPHRLSQQQFVEQLKVLKPFGPLVAALTLRRSIKNGWQRLEPEEAAAEWQAWLAETAARIKRPTFAKAATLDRWWRDNAPLLLRTDEGRLLALAVAYQAHAETGEGGDMTPRFVAILANPDPWSQVTQEAREKAQAKLEELTGGTA